jgi:very-short-patch-repair endonuclease
MITPLPFIPSHQGRGLSGLYRDRGGEQIMVSLPSPLSKIPLAGMGEGKGGGGFMGNKTIRMAKTLRKRLTDAKALLWRHLRAKRLQGFKFRRQQPIGPYIADFVCFEKRFVIEIDGGGHTFDRWRDRKRDLWLQGEGFMILRFWNNDVLQNIEGVLEVIGRHCLSHHIKDEND